MNGSGDGVYRGTGPANRAAWLALILVAVTFAVYGQTIGFDFVGYDDKDYLTQNPRFLDGLTVEDVRWAFTSSDAANWHPLTWMSHMLDILLFGLDPSGHHAISLLIHGLNTLLLFGALRYMTRAVGRSAFVAALFAVHPLHAETVAWVSERKDVLSTFFAMTSMWAYAGYARRPSPGRYLASALLLALGLMAKPMLVTLPLLFLLLDFWPLNRWHPATKGPSPFSGRRAAPLFLMVEKLPLLALAAISSLVTVFVQSEARTPAADIAFPLRAANAVVAYVRYMGKAIWPSDLVFLYPHPNLPGGESWALWQIAGSAAALAAITALAIKLGMHRRYLITGWLWFAVALVPVIGLVQVGLQAMADRYTYVPLVGLSIIIAWGAADLAGSWSSNRAAAAKVLRVVGTVLVLVWGFVTWRWQAPTWRDSITLYQHALKSTPNSPLMLNNLGYVLVAAGKEAEGIKHLRLAIQIKPDLFAAWVTLGTALRRQNQIDEAIDCLREAIRLKPESVDAHRLLAGVLRARGDSKRGDLDDAIHHYGVALQSSGADDDTGIQADMHFRRAGALTDTGRLTEALVHLNDAARLEPDWHAPLMGMAWILAKHPDPGVRDLKKATDVARRAAQMGNPPDPAALDTLATVYAASGRYDLAVTTAAEALSAASASSDRSLVPAIRRRLEAYERQVAKQNEGGS